VIAGRLRIIVTGQLAQYPVGGVTWFYFQYALGLHQLGHEVYYLEDSTQYPYNPKSQGVTPTCDFNVGYLADIMARYGLVDRWAYCFPDGPTWFGISDQKRQEVIQTADLLVNVSSALARPQDYRSVRRLAFIDTDPVFTQVKLARGQRDFQAVVDAHDIQFSYAEAPHSHVPPTGHRWRPTRAPIVLSEWRTGRPHRDVFTTVMNWTSFNSVTWNGETYGQKDEEFRKIIDLPRLVAPTVLELAIGPGHGSHTPYDLLRYKGWQLVTPEDVCPDIESYREYTEASLGEFSVAKNGYVKGQSGWFSERSARYLAAGRPVVVQETGFSSVIPTGEGVLPFRTLEEAADGIRRVQSEYERHCRAARALAEEYFNSAKVLPRLIEEAFAT
jgi:hypothetical protein